MPEQKNHSANNSIMYNVDMANEKIHIQKSNNALCSYPLKLGGQKFGKVKAQFSLKFVPNFKISVLTGKKLYKI